jgi:AcrR family transcriptional regulator
MTEKRKLAEAREKDLRAALMRIKHGRSNSGAKRISISSVAKEAGVSPALIHNHYPQIAKEIRISQGRDDRAQRDAKQDELKNERKKSRELRAQIGDLKADVARLASINEVLLAENETLRRKLGDKVVQFHTAGPVVSRSTHS